MLLGDEMMGGEMGRACDTHGREERFIWAYGGKTFKSPLGRPRHRWEDGCIHVAQDRDQLWSIVNLVMILWIP
jgi:hypothetical protein